MYESHYGLDAKPFQFSRVDVRTFSRGGLHLSLPASKMCALFTERRYVRDARARRRRALLCAHIVYERLLSFCRR